MELWFPVAAIDPNDVKPGWIGFSVVVLLCVATYVLWRSMKRQVSRVNPDLPRRERRHGSPDPEQPYAGEPNIADDPDGFSAEDQ